MSPDNGSVRRIPGTWQDAAYERLIEIQERQAAIAHAQAEAGVRRDEILAHLSEKIQEIPGIASRTSDDLADKIAEQQKRLVWWLFAATFTGSMLGGTANQLVDTLFKFHP